MPTSHGACAALLHDHHDELVTPAAVVAETAWLIESRLGPAAEARFLKLITTGQLEVIDLTVGDYARCVELIEAYTDLGLGLVDASIVAIAENLALTKIATLNHRDFRVVRPTHCDAFELVPRPGSP